MNQELDALWKILKELREIKKILIANSKIPWQDETVTCRVCGELKINHVDGKCRIVSSRKMFQDGSYEDDNAFRLQDGSILER